jgi:hypothetical protein
MKMMKSLFLGTVASFVALTETQAADLPVKATPVQYVKICSLYGAGFYYLPGTDTCIKLGGYVRAEYDINATGSFTPILNGPNAVHNRNSSEINSRVRGLITLDALEQTEYGTLRSYIAGGWQADNGGVAPTGTIGAATGTYRFFIQLAGFTAGFTTSYFDYFVWTAYSNTSAVIGSDTGNLGVTAFAYTAQFGNGLSASLSLEDRRTRQTEVINTFQPGFQLSLPTGNSNNGFSDHYAQMRWPDVVANIRLDQAWGGAQIMGALHQTSGNYFGAVEATGHPGDELGWAVGAGLKVNLPMLGVGDNFTVQAAYAQGASRYNGAGLPQATNISVFDGDTVGLGLDSDAVYNGAPAIASSLELTRSWSVTAGIEHNWVPGLRTSLYGAYLKTDYNDNATAFLNGFFNTLVAPGATLGSANPDFSYWQVGSRTVWSPVKNLDLSLEVMYNRLNTGYDGAVFNLNPGSGKPPAAYAITDQSWWAGIVRVQRNFYP